MIPENDGRFVYHGEVTHGKNRLFKRSNVMLVPSLDESCSLTALEGGMFGKPLIVTENVGAKYMIENSGLVVITGNAKALAEAIEFMILHKDDLNEMGKICYQKFLQTSTQDIYYENFMKVITEILSGNINNKGKV